MIDYYNNESRLTEILRAVVNSSTIDLGPARTREEIFVSRALGLTMWPAIPPRTTMEMWLAFIAGDTAEPAAGTYTVRTCAESCVITYARRVRGASAVVPIFPPHTHYERALAKLAGIVPIDFGVLGREWEHLLQQYAASSMPRAHVAIVGGSSVTVDGTSIVHKQLGQGVTSPDNPRTIVPGAIIKRDSGETLVVYDGQIDGNALSITTKAADLGAYSWNQYTFSGSKRFVWSIPLSVSRKGVDDTPVISSCYAGSSASAYLVDTPNRTIRGRALSYPQIIIRDDTYIDNSLSDGASNTSIRNAVTGYLGLWYMETPEQITLSQREIDQLKRGFADYLGGGVWRLTGPTVIYSEISTQQCNAYDLAPSATSGWDYAVTIDGLEHRASSGSAVIPAGNHTVSIVAIPRQNAEPCIIQPTLFQAPDAVAASLGSHVATYSDEPATLAEFMEPADLEEPVDLVEPVEPVEPETTKRRRAK